MKWDLTYHFADQSAFQKALDSARQIVEKLAMFEGKLGDETSFQEYYLLVKQFEEEGSKVYQYASLKSDLNKKHVENATELGKCRMLLYKISEVTAFEEPEILALGKATVMKYIDQNQELEEFRFYFEKIFRKSEHILDTKSEQLLSYFNALGSRGAELYSSLAVSDGKSVTIKLTDKTVVSVTQGNYRSLIANATNAADRKKIFEAVFNQFAEYKNTYANIYNTVLLTDQANARSKNYASILESYLFDNNIPTEVYHTLIKVASKENQAMKKYIKLRKKYLHLSTYHTYDRFIELATSNKTYSYEEAKALFFQSIATFPEDFQNKAHEVLKDGFVDVMEADGKRTGAYSSGVTNLHPFILLNFDNTLESVFTLAHEAGHSMHSMYAAENQPTMLQDYTIFVAEIASTFNEHILLDYFLTLPNATKEEKIMVVQKAMDNIMSTFYRQTLFAEYELIAHQYVENNQPINYEVLSDIMIQLYQKYYGLDITKENVKQYVWAYIPHLFYTPFYVYQYATSFAASFKLYKDVKEDVPGAFDRYIELLKSGGSKYPMDQAKAAGVDFTKEDAFMAVVERMNELVVELEKLMA